MSESDRSPVAQILDLPERVAEVLFGLIMALTFTGTIQVSMAHREEVAPVLVAAIGCNVAWGFVDGVMFLVRTLVDRSHARAALRSLVAAPGEADLRAILGERVPPEIIELLALGDLEKLRTIAAERLARSTVRLGIVDFQAAGAVCVLVVVATFPVVVPYLVFDDLWIGKRVSGAVAIAMLYGCGHLLGRHAGASPVRTGLVMVVLGAGLVALAIALGG